jgi:hypothetical protein
MIARGRNKQTMARRIDGEVVKLSGDAGEGNGLAKRQERGL